MGWRRMKKRYEWAGEIIDSGDGYCNIDGKEIVDRLNELDLENANLKKKYAECLDDLDEANAEIGACYAAMEQLSAKLVKATEWDGDE